MKNIYSTFPGLRAELTLPHHSRSTCCIHSFYIALPAITLFNRGLYLSTTIITFFTNTCSYPPSHSLPPQSFQDALQIHSFFLPHSHRPRRRPRPTHRRKPLQQRHVDMERRPTRKPPTTLLHPPLLTTIQGSSRAIKVHARSRYTEPIRSPPQGGVSIKVSRSEQLLGGHHTQFEYAISNNVLYYDISLVDCAVGQDASNCPGHIAGLEIYSPNQRKCNRVTCKSNTFCPEKAYYVDTPVTKLGHQEPVFGCGDAGTGADLTFVLCQNQRSV